MNVQPILTESLVVPPEFERETSNTTEDEQLAESIRQNGVQQPLIIARDGDIYAVIKGTRRLAIAKFLNIPKVPCVVLAVPDGEDPKSYMRKIRFIADEKRQDLLPTQRAELIRTIQESHKMKPSQLAKSLGITPDTLGNYLDVLKYIPAARNAIDAGHIKMHRARAFKGMTPQGQEMILRKHWKDLTESGRSTQLHERLREMYPPAKHPHLYLNPERTAELIARPQQTRKRRVTKNYSADEKKSLIADVKLQEREVAAGQVELKLLKRACMACGTVVAAILRDSTLHDVADVPPETLEELKAFSEAY